MNPSFIIDSDWDMQIRASVLGVVKNSSAALTDAVNTAIEEARSYLRSKYDVAKTFAPIYTWQSEVSYPKNTRILFSATAFSTTATYATDDLVSKDGFIYQAKENITAGVFNATKWDNIATNNSFFYVIATNSTAGILPTDLDEYTAGDTRNPMIVAIIKDIALYTIHSNISPNNIPQLRKDRYDGAIKWLNNVSNDRLSADLPLADTDQALGSMRLGGNTKYSERW